MKTYMHVFDCFFLLVFFVADDSCRFQMDSSFVFVNVDDDSDDDDDSSRIKHGLRHV
jgi:hypothetical protein